MTTAECFIFKVLMTGRIRDLATNMRVEVKNAKETMKEIQNQKKLETSVRK